METYRVDEKHDLDRTAEQTIAVEGAAVRLELPPNAVCLLKLRQ